MAKIIAVAENYAYGPVGKLLTVTKELLKQGHHITFIGEGTAYQLGSKEPFSKVVRINTNSDEFSKTMVEAFKNSDVVLSAMDRSSVMLAEKLKVSTIWLDTLFWWYDEIPGYMLNVDCYIKQNTLNDKKNCNKYAAK
jgi:UDP:flavonoid glycosyltransferase YjiC (YdhE family)